MHRNTALQKIMQNTKWLTGHKTRGHTEDLKKTDSTVTHARGELQERRRRCLPAAAHGASSQQRVLMMPCWTCCARNPSWESLQAPRQDRGRPRWGPVMAAGHRHTLGTCTRSRHHVRKRVGANTLRTLPSPRGMACGRLRGRRA
jgi:hypothetical protein